MRNIVKRLNRDEAKELGLYITERIVPEDYPLHWHEFYELEYILSGYGKASINNNEYILEPHTLIFLTPADFQYYKIIEPIKLININLTEDWIDDAIFKRLDSHTIIRNFNDFLFKALLLEYPGKNDLDQIYLKYLINSIFVHIARNLENKKESNSETLPIQKICQYIQLHFREQIKLSELADYVGLSPNYLSYLFSSTMGTTLKSYINNMRLNFASSFLILSDTAITDICYECGFNSFSCFSRAFKRRFNMTPFEYREKYKNNKNAYNQ